MTAAIPRSEIRRRTRPMVFDEILDIVFQGHKLGRIVMALEVYFDESGTHKGSPILVVAGYISTAERWKRFRREWASFLAKKCPGEAYFHSKDHIKDAIDPISKRAAQIVRRGMMYGFGVQVDEKAFMRYTTPKIRKDHGQSYDLCCQALLESMILIPEIQALEGNIFYVFGQGAPTEAPLLQSADILANLMFRTYREHEETNTLTYVHPVLTPLIKGDCHFLQNLDSSEIKRIIDQSPLKPKP